MKHFLIATFLTLTIALNAWSKCDENSVSVPFKGDDKSACFLPKSSIQVRLDKINPNEYVEFEIQPMAVEVENIPSTELHQFLNIEYVQNQAPKIHLISFLCSGEIPVVADAFSESLQVIAENSDEERSNTDVFIANGHASDNLSISQARKTRAKVFDRFLEYYEARLSENELNDFESTNVYVPNVIAGMALEQDAADKKLYASFFNRTNSSLNGCSKKFLSKMQNMLIENVSKTQPFHSIEVKKKRFSSRYQLKWITSSF